MIQIFQPSISTNYCTGQFWDWLKCLKLRISAATDFRRTFNPIFWFFGHIMSVTQKNVPGAVLYPGA